MLNKVLLKPTKETVEPVQRKDLLRTICKEKEICYKVVIESGITDNLVSIKMVEKLGLNKIKHLMPCKVSWLHKGHQILEQCEVEFQIGRYNDKILCDVMPIDFCHILLCRPWQFERKVVHDGRSSCYKFEKDGMKHTLLSLQEENIVQNICC